MIHQIASTAGAFMVLAAYTGLHTRRLAENSLLYLGLNFVGASLLLFAALVTRQLGFIILEAAWVGITVYGYLKRGASPGKL